MTDLGLRVLWISLALALVPVDAGAQIFSPGKLTRAHAALDANCSACHGTEAGRSVAAKHCLACHQPIAESLAAGRGFHGRRETKECTRCHQEHKGRGHQLISWPGGGQASFDHRRYTGFGLQGQHSALNCRRCHQPRQQRAAAVQRLPEARRRRTFLGLEASCASCHSDPHGGALGQRCLTCHDERGFKPVTKLAAHQGARFALSGRHQQVSCAKCHQREGRWQLRGIAYGDCADCHRGKSPHRDTMGQGRAPAPLACKACHSPSQSWREIAFDRARHPSQIPLTGGHARVTCRQCHGVSGGSRPKGTSCNACHQDSHQRRFGDDCSKCHGSRSWRVSGKLPVARMSQEQRASAQLAGVPLTKVKERSFHNKTRYPLTGKHLTVSCERCHRIGREPRQRQRMKFLKPFGRCSDCHPDEHRGQFRSHVTVNARTAEQCESCHPLGGLALTSFDRARHEQGRFPLRGAHLAVPCRSCHGKKRQQELRFTYGDRDCRVCHRDPHQGKFRLGRGDGASLLSCAACHQETSFAQTSFDHQRTGFPLRGRHAAIACSSCHRPGPGGVIAFAKLSPRCASCHQDPHGGQFASASGPADCARCHSDQGFRGVIFDHARQTRFPLRGAHLQASCASCHHQATLADGKQVRAYRLKSIACQSCHQPRHEKLISSAGGKDDGGQRLMQDCRLCHQETRWRQIKDKAPAGFEHRLTGYELQGRHRGVACATCHRQDSVTSRQCGNCHEDRHRGKLGTQCAECHQQGTWRPSAMLSQHRQTRLPLTGWHATTDCSSCHPRSRDGVFRGVPTTCYGCHAERYHDPSTHPDHARAGFDTRCEQCHRPTGWVPAAFSQQSSQLQVSHRFPLQGRHAQLACAECHQAGARPPQSCASCHRQDLARASTLDHRAAGLARQDCGRCHDQRSFARASYPDHARHFPLLGAHRQVSCTSCHSQRDRFTQYTCTSCHQQGRAAGQHERVRGYLFESRACRRCHPDGRR